MIINHFIISAYATSFTTFILGAFVFSRDPSNRLYRIFSAYSFSIAIWSFAVSRFGPNLSPAKAAFFGKLLHFGAILIPILFVHFVSVYLHEFDRQKRKIILVYCIGALFQILNFFTPWLINGTSYRSQYSYPTPGVGYLPFFVFFVLCVCYGLNNLVHAYQRSSGLLRSQLKYLLVGSVIGYTGGLDNFLITIDLQIFPLYPFGAYAVALYVFLMSYAIVTTRLMDIELVIKKGIVYASLSAILALFYFLTVYVAEFFFRGFTSHYSSWVMVPAILVFAVIFQPLRDRIQAWVDSIFFKSRYDYQQILSRYTKALRRPTTDLNRLLKIAPYLLTKSMKLSGAGVLILDRNKGRYEMRAGEGAYREMVGMTISSNFMIIRKMEENDETLSIDEVGDELKKEMSGLKASLLIPSTSKSEYFKGETLIAVFVFGSKLSDDPFSREDISFLETLARQASITIEYAFILEELRRDEAKIVQSEKFAALGTMAGSVVGALRAPIDSMENYSSTMLKRFNNPDFREGFIRDIPRDIMRLDKVVNDLLVYARPMKLNMSKVDLNSLVEKAVGLLKIKESKEHINVKTGYSRLPEVNGDPPHLLNAIVRLLSFCIASAKKELYISTGFEGRRVYVSVAVPGYAIQKASLDKIFVSYFSPKEGEGGLELATASKIVKEHGGDISVRSDELAGTKFIVSIPVETRVSREATAP